MVGEKIKCNSGIERNKKKRKVFEVNELETNQDDDEKVDCSFEVHHDEKKMEDGDEYIEIDEVEAELVDAPVIDEVEAELVDAPVIDEVDTSKSSSLKERVAQRERKPSSMISSPFVVLKAVPRINKISNMEKILELYRSGKPFHLSVTEGASQSSIFWEKLLMLERSNGWLDDNHIWAWTFYMYSLRPENATWSILPPWFHFALQIGRSQLDMGNGRYPPWKFIMLCN